MFVPIVISLAAPHTSATPLMAICHNHHATSESKFLDMISLASPLVRNSDVTIIIPMLISVNKNG